MSLTDAADGRVLWRCHAGCEQEAVADALRSRGLIGDGKTRTHRSEFHHSKFGEPSATWTYRHADGKLAFVVARYDTPQGKELRPWRPNGTAFEAKAIPAPRPLYRLPELLAEKAKPVLVVEGEKCADAAARLLRRYVCITWPAGAEATGKVDLGPLRGRKVTIWPDADAPGCKAAAELAERLRTTAQEVAVVKVEDRPEGWDVADAIAEGWTEGDLETYVEEHASPATFAKAPEHFLDEKNEDEFDAVRSAREVMAATTGPARCCVPGRVPAGLVIIGARPKARKSWWALQLGIAKATAGRFMGVATEGGRVLYIALEDNDRRMRQRLEFFGLSTTSAPERLHVTYDWPTGLEGVEKLERWLAQHPDTVLIIIDVLQRFRGPRDAKASAYEADYQTMGMLHGVTQRHDGITILVVHHVRKGAVDDPVEAINGTFAIAGAADAYIILRRGGEKDDWIAHIDGRDWESWDHEFLWRFLPQEGWRQVGLAEGVTLTETQREILAAAKEAGHITPTRLAERRGTSKASAGEALQALVAKGAMRVYAGKYYPLEEARA